jgi:hypothetical protein
VSSLIPLGKTPPFNGRLRDGDVLFVVDAVFFEYNLVVVNAVSILTSVNLISTPNPSFAGAPVTIGASVTPIEGDEVPTGSLTFYVDGDARGTIPLADGQASLELRALPIGSHTLLAQFIPAGNDFGESLASLTQRVVPSRTRSVHH